MNYLLHGFLVTLGRKYSAVLQFCTRFEDKPVFCAFVGMVSQNPEKRVENS